MPAVHSIKQYSSVHVLCTSTWIAPLFENTSKVLFLTDFLKVGYLTSTVRKVHNHSRSMLYYRVTTATQVLIKRCKWLLKSFRQFFKSKQIEKFPLKSCAFSGSKIERVCWDKQTETSGCRKKIYIQSRPNVLSNMNMYLFIDTYLWWFM